MTYDTYKRLSELGKKRAHIIKFIEDFMIAGAFGAAMYGAAWITCTVIRWLGC